MANATAQARAAAGVGGREVARWIERLARLGYLAKGVVYGLVGILALRLAFGQGGETTDAQGVLREIAGGPFGTLLLTLIGVGLLGYAAWRFVQGIKDVEGQGDETEGIVKRAGYVGSGVIHGALAFTALNLAWGSGSGSGSGGSQGITAELLGRSWGVWLVGLVGLITIAVGLYQFYLGYQVLFKKHWNTGAMSRTQELWATRAGRAGLMARGVVFVMMGWFFLQAARQSDPSEARGLDGALTELLSQTHGTWLLALVAAGLVCYAVYCFVQARFRHFRVR
ncbi:MAG TPA: DUF1206 domain-containing protein [Thermoanaerobaculia bacterium]|nr:DUF1206 domain-containing protein [Thermoanaerobaculia bacterium]